MRVLITGVTGFVGRRLASHLTASGYDVIGAMRRVPGSRVAGQSDLVAEVEVQDLAIEHDWRTKLAQVDVIVHLAARVHVLRETHRDPSTAFRQVNVEGTRRLAEAAVNRGVKRFVYVSSIKVNGETTSSRAFNADDPPAPADPYGTSKWEAEQALRRICQDSSMDYVIVRPPLVYGPGVKGNLARLFRLVRSGVPLPLASVNNRRSMVSLGNLVDLLRQCLVHPGAANQVFLVADGQDWSTPQLMHAIGRHLGRPVRLFPFPPAALRAAATLAGRRAVVDRLCGSLQVDISPTRRLLQWQPPDTPDQALAAAVGEWVARRD